MKKIIVTLLSALPVFALFLSGGTLAAEKIVISTGEYSPFVSKKLKNNGYVSDIISRAFAREGIDVSFKYLPWKRAYESAKKGDYAATSFWYESAERKKDFLYSDPVTHEKTVLFYRKVKPLGNWETFADLKDFKLGATIGYTYTKEFWEAGKKGILRIEETPKDLTNMKKLVAGRIDLFPAGIILGNTILNDNFDPAIAHTISYNPKPLTGAEGSLLFPKSRKDSARLLKAFNAGLKKLTDSGELSKMYDELLTGGYKKK